MHLDPTNGVIMDRTALRAAVGLNLAGRTDLTSVINTGLDFALNELTKAYGWKELEVTSDITVAGTTLTFTDGAWNKSALTLTKAAAFTSYTFGAGDHVYISGGTGMTAGWYEIGAKTSNNVLTLLESLGEDASDVAATKIGNPEYLSLPSDTLHVARLRLIDGVSSRNVILKTKSWLQTRWPNVAAVSHGRPLYAYEDKSVGRVYLYPIPNGEYTYRITVTKALTSFAVDATENPVTGLDLALVAWATGWAFQSVEQFENAGRWFAQAGASAANAMMADRRGREEFRAGDVGDEDLYIQSSEPWNDPFVKRIT